MIRRLFLLFTTVLAFIFSVDAQTKNLGSWNVLNTRFNINKQWGVFNELQLRSQSFYNNFYYYEVKGGIVYSLNKNFVLLLGAGKYITYNILEDGNFNKPVSTNETRLWQELTMNNYLERIKFEHRYRVEQRWINTGYRNRFRYRLNTAIPLNGTKIEPGTFFLTAFEEVFFTDKAPYFERNRFFAGAGYQAGKSLVIQPGYIYQFDYRSDNTSVGKHFFQLTFLLNLHADPDASPRLPSTVD